MSIARVLAQLPKEYYLPQDRELIERAYRIAEKAHRGQKRISGEPYITHCLAVASILAEMQVPPRLIAAGLLHDTVEDTNLTLEDIRRDFGDEIARMVNAVTKLTSLPRVSRGDRLEENAQTREQRAAAIRRGELSPEEEVEQLMRSRRYDLASETLRKTFLAMADDPSVVLVKLADRLHNMRTLHYMPPHKQKRIAQETMDIFAPLANRLGIWQIKWELEDLALRYINPKAYNEIAGSLKERRSEREHEMQAIKIRLMRIMEHAGLQADVSARPKHINSIYRKMQRKGVPFEMVYDVRGVRIILNTREECYQALGAIHSTWRPIPGEFDDYIAAPKDNFYQSLHTAVIYDDGKTLEVQIRTHEMHERAEYGIAAHWRYKEGGSHDPDFDRRVDYIRQLMEWRQDVEDAREFVDSMKSDVFGDRVYVFTPRGDIIDLPAGATPIDFAYHVHTEVGHRCRGAKVGGKLVPLDYELKTGDQVDILTTKRGGPSRDWLNPNLGLVKTQRARSKIRRWFKQQAREQNIERGKAILERELRQLGLPDTNLEELARQFEYRTADDFAEAIGCGDISTGKIAHALVANDEQENNLFDLLASEQLPSAAQKETTGDITVRGLQGLLTNMARCCNPTPGDEIIGYITRGRGATIHRIDCPNILRIKDRERLVQVSWGRPMRTYSVPIRVKAYDRNGLMKDISTLLANEKVNITKVRVDVKSSTAIFALTIEVRGVEHLSRVLDRLEGLDNIFEARRVRPG